MPTTSPDNISYPSNTDPQKTIEQRIEDTAVSVQAAFNTRAISQNYIINGGMDIWQRGTSFNLSGYTADRWAFYYPTGSGTLTMESTIVPSGFNHSVKIVQTGATGAISLLQSIESLNSKPLAGKTLTISAYVYGTVPTDFLIAMRADAEVDKTPIGSWTSIVASTTQTVGSNWTKITATGVVPANANTIRADFAALSPSLSQPFYVTGFQVEEGSYATPFRRNQPNLQAELAACQRYYWRFTQADNYQFWTLCSNWGGELMGAIKLPVTMRVRPSLSISNLAAVFWLGNNTNYSGATGFSGRPSTEIWAFACSTASVPTNVPVMMRPATGTFIEANAEL
jgi:hypothetical protein